MTFFPTGLCKAATIKKLHDVFLVAQTTKKLHVCNAETLKKFHFFFLSDDPTDATSASSGYVHLIGPAGPAIAFPRPRRPRLHDENAAPPSSTTWNLQRGSPFELPRNLRDVHVPNTLISPEYQ